MIIVEFYDLNSEGNALQRTYSDAGFQIQKVGTDEIYDEAIDLISSGFTYVEVESLIDNIITEF